MDQKAYMNPNSHTVNNNKECISIGQMEIESYLTYDVTQSYFVPEHKQVLLIMLSLKTVIFVTLFLYARGEYNASSPMPVLIWHGMGDHGSSEGIQYLGELISRTIPGTTVECIVTSPNVFEDIEDTYLKPINEQIEQVCQQILSNPKLQQGVHLIGLSQGGLFVRALAQRCPLARLGSVISIGGPQSGIYGIPKCPEPGPAHLCHLMQKLLSYAAYSDFLQEHLVQAQYWHDPYNEKEYREKCHFMADINQEVKFNKTYRDNLLKVKNLVLVQFGEDTVLRPKESEWFGFYNPMTTQTLHTLEESLLYKKDLLGLKKLEEDGRLHLIRVDTDHLRFSAQWFENEIIKKYLVQ